MLCVALFVYSIPGLCLGDDEHASFPPLLLLPPPTVSRRMSAAQVLALRRQLMRDNYDYQHSDARTRTTPRSGANHTNFYYRKSGTNHLPPDSNLIPQSNAFSAYPGQNGRNQQSGEYEQPDQTEQRGQYAQHPQYEHRVEQARSMEHKDRVAPYSGGVPARDVHAPEYTLDRRDVTSHRAWDYQSTHYNKQRDPYDLSHIHMQERPFSDLRGNYKEQYRQNQGDIVQGEQVKQPPKNDVHSPDQEYTPDEQEAFAQQDSFGSEDDDVSDFSESKEQPHRDHNVPPHRANNAPLDEIISKKDLLYYMDETQLRRRNNKMSPDVTDEDQPADIKLPSPQPNTNSYSNIGSANHTSLSNSSKLASPEPPRTERAHRSFVVTVSGANVTYKLLTLKSGGRRRGPRRILEERAPGGVAILSLDHAPLPAFRLPRARRQYMHEPHHHDSA